MASTLDSNVNASAYGIIAVCSMANQALSSEPDLSILQVRLSIPSNSTSMNVTINELYNLTTPSDLWNMDDCFEGYTLCDGEAPNIVCG